VNECFGNTDNYFPNRFQETVLSVSNLVTDYYFDAFTRPIINNKFEEKTCGDGPSLTSMFDDDRHLNGLIERIKVLLYFIVFQFS